MVVAGKYVRIIWNPNLVTFSCIGILYGGLHECGFEVRKPTQEFKSVKDLGNIFDLNPKWQELCRP